MEGSSRAFGAESTIKWRGETYLFSFTVRDYGVVENHLLKMKKRESGQSIANIMGALHGKIPDELWSQKLDELAKNSQQITTVSSKEVQEWVDSREGAAFTLWVGLERKYPGQFKLEEMTDILIEMHEEEFNQLLEARDQAAGMDAAGNSIGPPPGDAAGIPNPSIPSPTGN